MRANTSPMQTFCCSDHSKMGRNFLFGCVVVFFFFSTKNQLQQLIIGKIWVIHHFKALWLVIWTKFSNFERIFWEKLSWEKLFENFSFFLYTRASKVSKHAYLCLVKAFYKNFIMLIFLNFSWVNLVFGILVLFWESKVQKVWDFLQTKS